MAWHVSLYQINENKSNNCTKPQFKIQLLNWKTMTAIVCRYYYCSSIKLKVLFRFSLSQASQCLLLNWCFFFNLSWNIKPKERMWWHHSALLWKKWTIRLESDCCFLFYLQFIEKCLTFSTWCMSIDTKCHIL